MRSFDSQAAVELTGWSLPAAGRVGGELHLDDDGPTGIDLNLNEVGRFATGPTSRPTTAMRGLSASGSIEGVRSIRLCRSAR